MESNPVEEEGASDPLDAGAVATSDAGALLWQTLDRIRAGLLKQEVMRTRTIQTFEVWAEKARPHFDQLITTVTAECERHYGLVLCAWLDWLDTSGLAFRGEIRWQIPTKGPLTFTPPSIEGLMKEIGKIVGELHLEGAVTRSARWSVAPTQKTPGARGRGRERGLTVRK
jgi:hypothetical protein